MKKMAILLVSVSMLYATKPEQDTTSQERELAIAVNIAAQQDRVEEDPAAFEQAVLELNKLVRELEVAKPKITFATVIDESKQLIADVRGLFSDEKGKLDRVKVGGVAAIFAAGAITALSVRRLLTRGARTMHDDIRRVLTLLETKKS